MIAAVRELAQAVDAPVLDGDKVRPYLGDATEARGSARPLDAVVVRPDPAARRRHARVVLRPRRP